MRMAKVIVTSFLLTALTIAGVCGMSAESAGDKPACTIRDVKQQVVLYTIHRGGLESIGPVVADLFGLAGQHGIYPDGPIMFAYLNYFRHTSSEHWLTEIRLPVDKQALKLSGTLGKMTDVKTVSAMKAAVATKPEGMADPLPIYHRLYTWMLKHGHMPTSGPRETFLTNAEAGDYTRMKTEIMVPIWEPPSQKD